MMGHATLTWFARHELQLAWRDWAAMMAGARTTRERLVTLIVLCFVAGLHWIAYAILKPILARGVTPDLSSLIVITATLATTFSMILSQAIEHVTRAFYARSDLDLILSSPAPARHLFAVRILAIAATGAVMAGLLAAPFINTAVALDGPRWLGAYAVIAAMSALATAMALAAAMAMFRAFGAKRTRLIAQIIAAVVGAALLIAIQAIAVLMYGNFSRMSVLTSPWIASHAPDPASMMWTPARAVLGDAHAALGLLTLSMALLTAAIWRYAPRFADHAIDAAGLAHAAESNRSPAARRPFVARTTAQALRHKEWILLKRDPWLLSQTLMQILYLIPPALMLWKDIGATHAVHVILAPVLVMAFGQLAGGLAWLALSGEDAPDLVATAPISPRAQLRAKVQAVLAVIAAGAVPFIAALYATSTLGATATAAGIVCASAAAITIQVWFKASAKRAMFRRRQVASRGATFAEAFSSIFWAGAAGFFAAGSLLGIFFGTLALLVLAITFAIRPREA